MRPAPSKDWPPVPPTERVSRIDTFLPTASGIRRCGRRRPRCEPAPTPERHSTTLADPAAPVNDAGWNANASCYHWTRGAKRPPFWVPGYVSIRPLRPRCGIPFAEFAIAKCQIWNGWPTGSKYVTKRQMGLDSIKQSSCFCAHGSICPVAVGARVVNTICSVSGLAWAQTACGV